jgi:hypothetical protein
LVGISFGAFEKTIRFHICLNLDQTYKTEDIHGFVCQRLVVVTIGSFHTSLSFLKSTVGILFLRP